MPRLHVSVTHRHESLMMKRHTIQNYGYFTLRYSTCYYLNDNKHPVRFCWSTRILLLALVLVTSLPGGMWNTAIMQRVCLSVHSRGSKITRRNCTKLCLHVICGRNEVLLWSQRNTLCISCFANDVMFSHNDANTQRRRGLGGCNVAN